MTEQHPLTDEIEAYVGPGLRNGKRPHYACPDCNAIMRALAVCQACPWRCQWRCYGSIRGRKWKFVETPKERLKRLVKEGADEEVLLNMIDQLEDN